MVCGGYMNKYHCPYCNNGNKNKCSGSLGLTFKCNNCGIEVESMVYLKDIKLMNIHPIEYLVNKGFDE